MEWGVQDGAPRLVLSKRGEGLVVYLHGGAFPEPARGVGTRCCCRGTHGWAPLHPLAHVHVPCKSLHVHECVRTSLLQQLGREKNKELKAEQ